MPYELLEQFLEKLNTFSNQSSTLTDGQKSQIAKLSDNVNQLLLQTKESLSSENDGTTLSVHDSTNLYGLYNGFCEKCKSLSETYLASTEKNRDLEELLIPTSNLSIQIADYSNKLKAHAEGPEGQQTKLSQILQSADWINNLLNDAPNSIAKKPVETENVEEVNHEAKTNEFWNYQAHTIEENCKQYKESRLMAAKLSSNHYTTILGSENHQDTLKYKTAMIQSFIKGFAPNKELDKYLTNVIGNVRLSEYKLNNPEMLLSKSTFELDYSRGNDSTNTLGKIERAENLTSECKSAIGKFISKIKVDPYKIGFSDEKLEILDGASTPLFAISNIKTYFEVPGPMGGRKRNPDPKLDTIINSIESIESKVKLYMKGESEQPPTMDDYTSVMDAMGKYVQDNPVFDEKGKETLCEQCCKLSMELKNYYPELSDKCSQIENNFKGKIQDEFNKSYGKISQGEVGGNKISGEFEKIYQLTLKSDAISDEQFDKAYHMVLLRDPAYRKKQFEGARSLLQSRRDESMNLASTNSFRGLRKDISNNISRNEKLKKIGTVMALCKFADMEERQYSKRAGMDPDVADIMILENQRYKEFLSDPTPTLNAKQVENLEAIISDVKNNDALNAELNDTNNLTNRLLNPDNDKKLLKAVYGKRENVFYGIEPNDIAALIQNNKSDSPSYRAIGEKLNKLRIADGGGGANVNDYAQLYNSLRAYVYSHDSKPFSSTGQERFHSAAKLMANIGISLCNKIPELSEKIEKDFAVTMVRSEEFRQHLLQSSIKQLTYKNVNREFLNKMNSDAINVEAKIKEQYHHNMITGKLKPGDEEKLLDKYSALTNPNNPSHINVQEPKKSNSDPVVF